MHIHQSFIGGNICVKDITENTVILDNELRDTSRDWFYWAFCAEGAQGKTVTFRFPPERLGYYGPAVSHDLKLWTWLGKGEEPNAFTYTFSEAEDKVYFAHSMLYHPERFYAFTESRNIPINTLCTSRKGRAVPYITFGEGIRTLLLTARHHACESTGNYVLEGVLSALIEKNLPDTKVICVPFVDFDGVLDGDQGKDRAPHDQNRDYTQNEPSIYAETEAIRKLADNGVTYGFDFHSPWHFGGRNDTIFIVEKNESKLAEYNQFAAMLENAMTSDALTYDKKNNILPGVEWNNPNAPSFACYMDKVAGAKLAFTLETAYFGTEDNIFSQDKAIALGKCFAQAIHDYDAKH